MRRFILLLCLSFLLLGCTRLEDIEPSKMIVPNANTTVLADYLLGNLTNDAEVVITEISKDLMTGKESVGYKAGDTTLYVTTRKNDFFFVAWFPYSRTLLNKMGLPAMVSEDGYDSYMIDVNGQAVDCFLAVKDGIVSLSGGVGDVLSESTEIDEDFFEKYQDTIAQNASLIRGIFKDSVVDEVLIGIAETYLHKRRIRPYTENITLTVKRGIGTSLGIPIKSADIDIVTPYVKYQRIGTAEAIKVRIPSVGEEGVSKDHTFSDVEVEEIVDIVRMVLSGRSDALLEVTLSATEEGQELLFASDINKE